MSHKQSAIGVAERQLSRITAFRLSPIAVFQLIAYCLLPIAYRCFFRKFMSFRVVLPD